MRHLFRAVALSSLLFAACSKENKINQNNASTTTIGPSGGIVDGPDGTELRVPGGAVTEDTAFGIAVAQPGEYPPLDTTWDVSGKVYAFTPHGFAFLTPAIVALPAGTGTTLITAERNGSWTEAGGDPAADMLETSVTHFSFFASASAGVQADGGGPTCSGRGPATGPTSTASLTGVVPGATTGQTLDTATLRWGYAVPSTDATGGTTGLKVVFTPYDNPCGYVMRGVHKIGASQFEVSIIDGTGTVTTIDYDATATMPLVTETPAATPPGACSVSDNPGGPAGSPGAAVLSVIAIDSNHIQGTFTNLSVPPGTVNGTFDVPLCTLPTGLMPADCCIP